MTPTTEREPKAACLVCRQRKVACDRRRPRCSLCQRNDFECEYKSRQQRPGLRAGYVSRLERQLEDVQKRLRHVENHLTQGQPTITPFFTHHSQVSVELSVDHTPTALEHRDTDFNAIPCERSRDLVSNAAVIQPLQSHTMMADYSSPASNDESLLFLVNESLRTWFKSYHAWFPILHKGTYADAGASSESEYALVHKAITSVVIGDQTDAQPWNRTRAAQLRDQVMLEGLGISSLRSIQALLVLSNSFYTKGDLTGFWNMLASCKRMLSHPNLQRYASKPSCVYTSRTQMTRNTSTPTEQEEALRAFWCVEMLDAISSLGLPHYSTDLSLPLASTLPCLESQWSSASTLAESLQQDNTPSSATKPQYSSGFALCIVLAAEEVKVVREFLSKPYQLEDLDQRLEWQAEAQRLDERLTNWREEFVAAVFQLINYERDHIPRGEMDPFFTLTNCVLNTAIIVLLQQMAPMPKEISIDFEPWAFATTRCTYACENLTAKIRRIGPDNLTSESPHLIIPIFTAARFYVVYSKALDANVPANLHTLAFMLHSCSKRWPLAQMYETVIRTAVAEHRSPISQCVLPVEFYDFRYATMEITDILKRAAESLS